MHKGILLLKCIRFNVTNVTWSVSEGDGQSLECILPEPQDKKPQDKVVDLGEGGITDQKDDEVIKEVRVGRLDPRLATV